MGKLLRMVTTPSKSPMTPLKTEANGTPDVDIDGQVDPQPKRGLSEEDAPGSGDSVFCWTSIETNAK